MKTIYFLSGLPRSGSTLLSNILAQNPEITVTPTNGVNKLLNIIKSNWGSIHEFKAQGIDNILPKMRSSLRGTLAGFYESDNIVIDKDRSWLNDIEFIEDILGYQVKIIVTVRDIKDIISSFEKLNRSTPIMSNTLFPDQLSNLSIKNRINTLLLDTGVIGRCVNAIQDAFTKGYNDRLIIIPFNNLTNNPENTITELYKALNIDPFKHNFTNIEQSTKEDDLLLGIQDLHTIRPTIAPIPSDAISILGKETCAEIDTKYININSLCG